MLSFVHKKETEYSIELSLPICVFYRRIFSLEMQNFSLENHRMMNAHRHFVDGWHLLRCQIHFFIHPLIGWHDHWTFVGEGGMGYLVVKVIIFPKPLELEFFFPRLITGVRFFGALYVMSDTFFSAGYCFSQEFLCMLFSSRNHSSGCFFSEITNNPLKTQIVGP